MDILGMGGTHPRVDVLLDWIGVAFLMCNNDLICLNVHFCLIRIHILWSCTRPQTLLQFTELSLPLPQTYLDFCNNRVLSHPKPVAILLETKAALLQIVIIASKLEVCIREDRRQTISKFERAKFEITEEDAQKNILMQEK
ncbi:hypothetical protein MRB53_005817 [Persea americana]|uniref:Uncharacterized protein n=1 Tax=Persea americana TaxID=3435 RepID=A0ACC2MFD6_PERAE|nr:hypothetical protein MRB53_005817 [Persea americana]